MPSQKTRHPTHTRKLLLYNAGPSPNLEAWSTFTNLLNDNEDIRKCELRYVLRPVDEIGEDYVFEYHGVPLAVEDDYVIGTDYDIE